MYEMKRRVTYSQVGSNLLVDAAMLTYFFQDCTLFHSDSIGKGIVNLENNQKAWFLSSWQIEIDRYPRYGETITVKTWPHEFKGLYGYRNFEILDEQGCSLVKANSIWIFMDVSTLRPVKATQEDIQGYDMSPALDMEYAPRKISILEDADTIKRMDAIPVKKQFIDSNFHVNNGRYVEEAMEYFEDTSMIIKLRVDYRKAATLQDHLYPVVYQKDNCIQVAFEDANQHIFVIVEGFTK